MKKLFFGCLILLELCVKSAYSQQTIDSYVRDSINNVFTVVASSSNALNSPVDLDFYPNQTTRPFELWILNQGTSATGGSTVIVSNANQSTRTSTYVKDGNAWHFMSMASAIAFGDSLWATSADVLDANHSSGRYSGPTLWPGNLDVYGVVGNPSNATFNGSHLDMIHQSPYSKGIAFEKNLVYWVLDGYERNIKRYDYIKTHEPGGEDHSAGSVQVYPEFTFNKHATLPSHIVIDANKKYLYGCDPVGKRVFRIDITTGIVNGPGTKVNNEPLASYNTCSGLVFKDVVTTGLISPVGIDIYGDRLIVTDNATDEIIIYDIYNFNEIGRIKLRYAVNPDPMGIKVGPDGKIYFADKLNKKVYQIDNSKVFALDAKEVLSSKEIAMVYPNPATNEIFVQLNNSPDQSASYTVINVMGEVVWQQNITGVSTRIDISTFKSGIYFLKLNSTNKSFIQKIIKQ
ncbi:MAG: T9SS type A sorting domain-containing protein [Bacteroidia bacterium]|nr:T9SS type A sorting domain-containing protein [Bacteroidia bacterium]